jgi:hypothetical protein
MMDNNSDNDIDKHLANLFFNMYTDCVKYKNSKPKSKKNINCDEYWEKFKFFDNKITIK